MSTFVQPQKSVSLLTPMASSSSTSGLQEPARAVPDQAVHGPGAGGDVAAAGALFAPMFGDAAATSGTAAQAPAATGPAWMSIIPDAKGVGAVTSIRRSFGATGKITGVALGYGQSVHADGQNAAGVAEACQSITQERAQLHARAELHLVNFKQRTSAGVVPLGGYANQPAHQGNAAPGSLLAWLRTATPTAAKDKPPVLKQWEVYKRFLAWEGLPSAINAYDTANVTWGTGFAAGGQLEIVMNKFFAKDPAARQEFFAAGIALQGSQFVAVDPDKKWKLHGADAAHLIATDARLLSMFMNISEGVALHEGEKGAATDHRQAALDAQFETFQEHAGNVPADILGAWQLYPLALAAHAQHFAPAWFSWNGFRSTGGDVAAIKAAITHKAGAQAQYIILPDTHL